MKIRTGLRVKGIGNDNVQYTGTVWNFSGTWYATIKRDDGRTGSGDIINAPPYNGNCGWSVSKKSNGGWGSDGVGGKLLALRDDSFIGANIKRGDDGTTITMFVPITVPINLEELKTKLEDAVDTASSADPLSLE